MKKLGFIVPIAALLLLIGAGCSGDPASKVYSFDVTVKNVSENAPQQPLSPGVCIVETGDKSLLDLDGTLAPSDLETLAEYGEPAPFASYLGNQENIVAIQVIGQPTLPGEEFTFSLDVTGEHAQTAKLSCIRMGVATNDLVAVVNNMRLFDNQGEPVESTKEALNWDTGFEENSALGSGFDGGQPDPSRGGDNVENGTETDPQEAVKQHPQLSETIMQVGVTPAS